MPINLPIWISNLLQKKQSQKPKEKAPNPQSQPSNPPSSSTTPVEQIAYATSNINLLDIKANTPIDQPYINATLPHILKLCLTVNILLVLLLITNGVFEFYIQKEKTKMEETTQYINSHSQLEQKIQTLFSKISLYKSFYSQNKNLGTKLEKFMSQLPTDIVVVSFRADDSGIVLKAQSQTPLSFATFISNLITKKVASSVQIRSAVLNNTTKMFDVELEVR